MHRAASLFLALAVFSFAPGCGHVRFGPRPAPPPASAPAAATRAISPSPRLIVGRVLAVDPPKGFTFVEVGSDAPPAALQDGTELVTRALDLRETAQLRVSRYLRGRTLGTTVISGQPSPGDEVVWLAP